MLSNSQTKVVELHRSLMHHARLTGISDQELLISNSNLAQELESSQQYGARCDQCALCTLFVQKASHVDSGHCICELCVPAQAEGCIGCAGLPAKVHTTTML